MHVTTNSISNEQLARMVPSVFAGAPSTRVSSKYSFYPTIEIVNSLRKEGWAVVNATQSVAKADDRKGYQRHKIRFRREGQTFSKVGDSLPELVLINSHDGASSYQLHAGVYRLVCMNGMTVSDGLFQKIRVKHSGFKKDDIIEASYRVLESIPTVMDSVNQMSEIQLNREEQRVFAETALMVRYDDMPAPIASDQLLSVRRFDDRGGSLWKTLNVVQENIIKGGLDGWTQKEGERRKRIVTRPVHSIDRDVTLNKALWHLAERMKAIKAA